MTIQFELFTGLVEEQLQATGLFRVMDLDFAMALLNQQLEANIFHAKKKQYQGAELERHIDVGFSILWQGLLKV